MYDQINNIWECLKKTVDENQRTVCHLCAIVVFLTVLRLFGERVDSFVGNIWGSKYLDNSQHAFFILSLAAIFVLFWLKIKKIRTYSENLNIIFLYLFFVYTTYRVGGIEHQGWNFIKTPVEYLYYSDFLYILIMEYAVVVIKRFPKRHRGRTGEKDRRKRFDDPIQTPEEDKFGFVLQAEGLLLRLLEGKELYQKHALTIGLIGEWGSGKTSFTNLIKYKLSHDHRFKGKFLYLEYNPWHVSGGIEKIESAFLLKVRSFLAEYNLDLGNDFDSYLKAIKVTNVGGASNVIRLLQCFKKIKSIQDVHDDLSRKIERIGLPIMIVIDDIDRLGKEEISGILKLIRNTLNFNKFIFLVPYDEQYVVSQLSSVPNDRSQEYLEKIINIPCIIPCQDRASKAGVLQKHIGEIFTANSAMKSQIGMAISNIRRIENDEISLRHAVAFAYSVWISSGASLGERKKEICIYDLLLIEYFKEISVEAYKIVTESRFGSEIKDAYRLGTVKRRDKTCFYFIEDDEEFSKIYEIVSLLVEDPRQPFVIEDSGSLLLDPYRARYSDMWGAYIGEPCEANFISREDFEKQKGLGPKAFCLFLERSITARNRRCVFRFAENMKFSNEDELYHFLCEVDSICETEVKPNRAKKFNILLGAKFLDMLGWVYLKKIYFPALTRYFSDYSKSRLILYFKYKKKINQAMGNAKVLNSALGGYDQAYLLRYIQKLKNEGFLAFDPDVLYGLKTGDSYCRNALLSVAKSNLESFYDVFLYLLKGKDVPYGFEQSIIETLFKYDPEVLSEKYDRQALLIKMFNGEEDAPRDFGITRGCVKAFLLDVINQSECDEAVIKKYRYIYSIISAVEAKRQFV